MVTTPERGYESIFPFLSHRHKHAECRRQSRPFSHNRPRSWSCQRQECFNKDRPSCRPTSSTSPRRIHKSSNPRHSQLSVCIAEKHQSLSDGDVHHSFCGEHPGVGRRSLCAQRSAFSILVRRFGLMCLSGYYQDSVLKFTVTFPNDYPERPPTVRFLTDIFHPLVDPRTGAYSLAPRFRPWRFVMSCYRSARS